MVSLMIYVVVVVVFGIDVSVDVLRFLWGVPTRKRLQAVFLFVRGKPVTPFPHSRHTARVADERSRLVDARTHNKEAGSI